MAGIPSTPVVIPRVGSSLHRILPAVYLFSMLEWEEEEEDEEAEEVDD